MVTEAYSLAQERSLNSPLKATIEKAQTMGKYNYR